MTRALLTLVFFSWAVFAQFTTIPPVAELISGGVGGAPSLTTTGAIPYVASAGVLTQAPTGLFYDSANVRLAIQDNAPSHPLTFGPSTGAKIELYRGGSYLIGVESNEMRMSVASAGFFAWRRNGYTGSEIMRLAPTTGNLLLGTTTDAGYKLHVANTSGVLGDGLGVTGTNAGILLGGNIGLYNSGSGTLMFRTGTVANTDNGTNYGALFSNGNWTFGTAPVDGNYKLDVAASGSSGTLRVYDQTATTGSTSLVVRAGAGQSSNNLQEWQSSAGGIYSYMSSGGYMLTAGTAVSGNGTLGSAKIAAGYASFADFRLSSDAYVGFSSTSNITGSLDASISRTTASIIRIGDGGANANGYLQLRGIQSSGLTVSGLPTASAYAGMMIYVTDATATTIGSIVAGGGANKVMVWSDGTNWKIYAN